MTLVVLGSLPGGLSEQRLHAFLRAGTDIIEAAHHICSYTAHDALKRYFNIHIHTYDRERRTNKKCLHYCHRHLIKQTNAYISLQLHQQMPA